MDFKLMGNNFKKDYVFVGTTEFGFKHRKGLLKNSYSGISYFGKHSTFANESPLKAMVSGVNFAQCEAENTVPILLAVDTKKYKNFISKGREEGELEINCKLDLWDINVINSLRNFEEFCTEKVLSFDSLEKVISKEDYAIRDYFKKNYLFDKVGVY